ncbi:MAG TPA: hypothetical protein VE870_14310 [Bacteroidales bacterium]|nr:hypothetical protein [Bacteroidales bacterium]
MPRKDYMMRYFEQLGVVLAALLGFRAKRDYDQAFELIRTTLDNLPDFYYELANLDTDDFFEKVTGSEANTVEKTEMIATLLYEEAEFLILSGDRQKAADRYHKALLLLEYADRATGYYSVERSQRIDRCRKMTG